MLAVCLLPRRGIAGIVALVFGLTFASVQVPAQDSDHPAPLENARNQFTFFKPLRQAAQVPLLAADGSLLTLKRFRGKLVVLNLWATWCPPCIDELPSLDRLQAQFGEESLAVVALSVDEGASEPPFAFVARLGLQHVNVLHDFSARARQAFPLYGMPVTYLIDQQGFVVGYLVGAAAWDSPQAIDFLRHYLGGG